MDASENNLPLATKEEVVGSEKDAPAHNEAIKATSESFQWITGMRLVLIALGTALTLFMVQTESSVTSTTILAITNDLGGFQTSSWVFTAYLLTYGGFPIIISRLSDIFGRKQTWLLCMLTFIIFSGACGASQSTLQLIMFRWIKGIGAAGMVAIGTLYGFELRPPNKWAGYGAIMAVAIALSLAIAPVIGAAFAQVGKWRWAFLFNVPIGVSTLVLLFLAMPKLLDLEPAAAAHRQKSSGSSSRSRIHSLVRMDILGVFLLLGTTVTITASLQQAAKGISFGSAQVLVPLILSPMFLVAFVFWQWFLTARQSADSINPLLSWNMLSNRVFLAVMLNSWLGGAIMTVSIILIPQRFVVVNNISPLAAGVRLLPFAITSAVSSLVASSITSKAKVPPVNLMIFGGFLMTAGMVGFSKTPTSVEIWGPQYGFQVLAAIGVGIVNVMVILLPPHIVSRRDLAVANGAIVQLRFLGGALALAIITCAASPSLQRKLLRVLSVQETHMFLDRTETIALLSPSKQVIVREMNGEYYNLQMTIMIGFAVASVLASVMQWQKKPIIFDG